ncbi:MAG TPA: hypothetical protein VF491_17750 [Vicinamibacterales bacterium]
MQPELEELNRIRMDEDRSYNDLARSIGFKDSSHLFKLMAGRHEPNDRSMHKIRRFLERRRANKSERRSGDRRVA